MSPRVNAWIVIPVFNERATVGRVVTAARSYAPVIVVDDGSTDDSAAQARAAGAEVIQHPRRLGKGQALRAGLTVARGRGASHVVTLDGDGQHAPEDVPVLLAVAAREPAALVVGGRLDGAGLPVDRLNAIRVAGFFVNWASGLRVRDTQSGFRVYPTGLFDAVRTRRGGFVFETEVLIAAAAAGVVVREVPVTVIPRAGRRSRFHPIADGLAIGGYLGGRGLVRWGRELWAAAGEVAAIFGRERRRLRHREMFEAASCGANIAAVGTAVWGVAARHAVNRMAAWWRHPRCRRAAVAAGATLALPVLLVVALLQALVGWMLPDLVTPLVRRVYDQAYLDVTASDVGRAPLPDHSKSDAQVASPRLS